MEFEVAGKTWSLPTGSLFALGGGVEHSVKSAEGGMFLLTVSVAHAG